jgi:hypothetical protein
MYMLLNCIFLSSSPRTNGSHFTHIYLTSNLCHWELFYMISLRIALFVLLYAVLLYAFIYYFFFNCLYVLILYVILAKNAVKFLLFLK